MEVLGVPTNQIGLRTPLIGKGTAKISAAEMQHAKVSVMGQRTVFMGPVRSSQASQPRVVVQEQERRGIVITTIQLL